MMLFTLLAAGTTAGVVTLQPHPVLATTDAREVSFTYDIYALRPGAHPPFDLRNAQLRSWTAALQPLVLRVGGTDGENAMFGGGAAGSHVATPAAVVARLRTGGGGTSMFNTTAAIWDDVLGFAAAAGADLVLGLNQLLRKYPGDGTGACAGATAGGCPWDDRNARAWIAYNRDWSSGNATPIWAYELGNEPGCYIAPQYANISIEQHAADFGVLRTALADAYHSAAAPVPMVLGPDTGGCKHAPLLAEILAEQPDVDVATFHHYALPGGREHGPWSAADFVATALSNITRDEFAADAAALQAAGAPVAAKPLWVGEGATTYSQPLDGTYAALFNLLNILGEGGLLGSSLFAHQAIVTNYAVVGHQAGKQVYAPTVVYWCALLWKRLMGTGVLAADGTLPRSDAKLLSYARTSPAHEVVGTLLLANLVNATRAVPVAVAGTQAVLRCRVYSLTPSDKAAPFEHDAGVGLEGRFAQFNGKPIIVGSDGTLPTLAGAEISCGDLTMAPWEVSFVEVLA